MIKSIVFGVLVLAFCASSVGAQVQVTKSAGFLRTTIETYPEAERQPILNYLDAAKRVADRAAGQLASGHGENLVREIKLNTNATAEEINTHKAIRQFEARYGAVISYEYRAQAIESNGNKSDVHDLEHVTSAAFYAVRTMKRPDGELFLTIKTVRIRGEHKVFLINLLDYFGKVPPWLQSKMLGT